MANLSRGQTRQVARVGEYLFSIECVTCQRRLAVRDEAVIGLIITCPKCGSMVRVTPPEGWIPPSERAIRSIPDQLAAKATPPPPSGAQAPIPILSAPIEKEIETETEPGAPSGEPEVPLGSAALTSKRLLVFVAAASIVAAGLWTWALFSVSRVIEEESEPAENQIVAEPGPSVPEATAPAPGDRGLAVRWLPTRARLIVQRRFASLAERPEIESVVASLDPFWRLSAGRILNAFKLYPRNLRCMTWASVELSAWDERAIVILQFEQDQDAGALMASGEDVGWAIAGKPCRRLANDWPHPFVVIDPHTLISGPEDLLREVSDRNEPAFESEAIGRLVNSASPDDDFTLLVDLTAARDAGWRLPTALWDIWPAGRGAWRVIWETPKGMGLAVRVSQPSQTVVMLACEGESEAIKVRDAIGQFVPAAKSALQAIAATLTERLKAGRLTGAEADQYDAILQRGAAVLAAGKWEIVDRTVIFRLDWGAHLIDTAQAAVQSERVFRADWLEAALAADQATQGRLVESLNGFVKAEKQYPIGAAGGALLPAETRLSWIATLLPYLDRRDWHRELQFGYSWNSPQNRPVTQRPLAPVTNPALGPGATQAGFPVTHYVGVAGVGADAAELKTGDPRAGLFGSSRTVRPEDLVRGASNTLATLGVSQRLGPWAAGGKATARALTTRPYVNGPDGFGSGQPHGMVAGMADGSARFISRNVDPQVLEELATLRGGTATVASLATDPQRADAAIGSRRQTADARHEKPVRDSPLAAKPAGAVAATKSNMDETTSHRPARDAAAMAAEDDSDETMPSRGIEEDRSQKIDVTARLADRIPEIHFPAVPLIEAMRLMSQMSTVPVSFDLDWLQAVGTRLRHPVTVRLTGASVGEVFEALAASRNLACEILDDQVVVTAPTKQRGTLRPQSYRVADLTDNQAAAGDQLAAWTRILVAPDTWREAGGPGVVTFADGALNVTQTDLGHFLVRDFLDRLRLAHGKSPENRPRPPGKALATRFDMARARLRQPVTVALVDPTPLAAILRELERASQTTILLDGVAMSAAGISRDHETTLSVNQKPLSESLVSLLHPLGLTYRMVDGNTFEVTTRKAAAARLELELYSVAEILARSNSPERLMEQIKANVAGATWSDAGGTGVMIFDEASRTLLVLQTQPVQVRVQLFLEKL